MLICHVEGHPLLRWQASLPFKKARFTLAMECATPGCANDYYWYA